MTKLIVLIPHYNNYGKLLESIKSIDESIDIDILIVDDGSKVELPIKAEIEKIYTRGKVFLESLKKNQGIEFALNRGLELIEIMNYEYVGRLDCGDYCIKDRFKKQLTYLEENNKTCLLGTWVNILNYEGDRLFTLKHSVTYSKIKKKMYLNSMFVHPSVVFRTSILNDVGYYPTNYKAAEDYAFFFKIIKKHKSENLPLALLDYVIDDNSISSIKRKQQVKSRIRIIKDNFYFGYYPIYGLLRNTLLYFVSRSASNFIKKIFR